MCPDYNERPEPPFEDALRQLTDLVFEKFHELSTDACEHALRSDENVHLRDFFVSRYSPVIQHPTHIEFEVFEEMRTHDLVVARLSATKPESPQYQFMLEAPQMEIDIRYGVMFTNITPLDRN